MGERRQAVTRLTLDMRMTDIQRSIAFTKGDVNRRIEITLNDGASPFSLPATWTAVLEATLPDDGTPILDGCIVENGRVIYDFASGSGVSAQGGLFEIQFRLYDEQKEEVCTPKIWVNCVDPNRDLEPVESSDEFSAVSKFIEEINELNDRLDLIESQRGVTKEQAESLIEEKVPSWAREPEAPAEEDPTVPSWAKEKTKPSYTKNEIGLGNVDNVRQYSADNPPPYPVTSVNGKTGAARLTAGDVGADPTGAATSAVTTHNVDTSAHNDLRIALQGLSDRLNAVLNSDDTTLDELKEIVAYIKSNRTLIEAITTSKVNVADIINDLVTNVEDKPLSAAQGVILKGLIDAVGKSVAETVILSNVSIPPSEWSDSSPTTAFVSVTGLTLTGCVVFLFPADDSTRAAAATSRLTASASPLYGMPNSSNVEMLKAEVAAAPSVTLHFMAVVIKDDSESTAISSKAVLVGVSHLTDDLKDQLVDDVIAKLPVYNGEVVVQ